MMTTMTMMMTTTTRMMVCIQQEHSMHGSNEGARALSFSGCGHMPLLLTHANALSTCLSSSLDGGNICHAWQGNGIPLDPPLPMP